MRVGAVAILLCFACFSLSGQNPSADIQNRLQNYVELLASRNENIDVINYTTNTQLYIQRALNPAKILNIKIFEADSRAEVYLRPEEVSLAIGKGGLNIRLAGQLTGYELDVYREMDEDDEDVKLDEFSDEIESWILDELKAVGCDTAKSVLDLSVEDLVKRTDLEEETIREIRGILSAEFE